MKKILIWILVVVIIISMTIFAGIGCKKTTTETTAAATTAAVTTAAETTAATTVAETTAAKQISGKLEIFSWYTQGGEVLALKALIDIYNKKFPNVEIINSAVAGGAGTNAKAILATRLQGGNPPDSFQIHAGQELKGTWGVTGLLEPINFLYEENNWYKVFPKDLIDILSYKGEILSVPPHVHRVNVLWYNKKIFNDNGLQPPKTFDEFFTISQKLKGLGIIPLAHGDKEIWTSTTLFEDILLGVLGPDKYKGLFDGSVKWDSAEVEDALNTFVRFFDYMNNDHAALLYTDADDLVISGKAAMTVMGDWAYGYFKSKNWTQDLGWITTPGSEGAFNAVSDSFSLPKNAPNREAAIEWLKLLGSKEGQDAFNPLKGSIPARTDIDISLYEPYFQSTAGDYKTSTIVPSIAHGAAVVAPWLEAIADVITVLVADKNVDSAIIGLQKAADNNLSDNVK